MFPEARLSRVGFADALGGEPDRSSWFASKTRQTLRTLSSSAPTPPSDRGAKLDAVRNQLFDPDDSLASSPLGIPRIEIPVGEFRIPPVEIPDMLPQQQLMLAATANALDHAGVGRSLGDRTGVFVGVSLDPNATNYHCRWAISAAAKSWSEQLGLRLSDAELNAWIEDLQTAFGPPLTANRVMGNLAAITASRIAREFDIGGPSFTIAADEDSGLRAVEIAVGLWSAASWTRRSSAHVEFGSDIRARLADLAADGSIPANDSAIAFILKRRSDAERDGNPVLAKLRLSEGFVPSPLKGRGLGRGVRGLVKRSPPLPRPLSPVAGARGEKKSPLSLTLFPETGARGLRKMDRRPPSPIPPPASVSPSPPPA